MTIARKSVECLANPLIRHAVIQPVMAIVLSIHLNALSDTIIAKRLQQVRYQIIHWRANQRAYVSRWQEVVFKLADGKGQACDNSRS